MKINDENIGKFFQDQLKDVEVQPDAAVWSNIKQQSGISSGLSSLAKAALYILGTVIVASSYFIWQQIDENRNATSPDVIVNNQEETIAPRQNIEESSTATNKNNGEEKANTLEESKVETVQVASQKMINNQETISENKQQQTISNKNAKADAPVKIASTNSNNAKAQIVKRTPEEELYQAHYVGFGSEESEVIDSANGDLPTIPEPEINSIDSAKIKFSKNPAVCFGEDALLIVEGGKSYDWNTGANTTYIKVSPVEQSDYWVIVTDNYGNEIKHTFTVYIDKECTAIFVPSAFTPNGDGINDIFKAEGLGIQSFEMVIFNREGQIIFESHSIENGWDGSYRNERTKPRAYFYQISYTDAKGNPQNKRGQVTLIK